MRQKNTAFSQGYASLAEMLGFCNRCFYQRSVFISVPCPSPPPAPLNSMSDESAPASVPLAKPLSATARRCLGVLIEKAKTTPDSYPLSLAGIVTGSNQKSNRDPQTNISEDDAMLALDELREAGAVREIQGSGRVNKFRHAAYEWFACDSPGTALMTELLLRGPQTVGELRTRASRMHPFVDLNAVQAELDSLTKSGLVLAVSAAGRGQIFAHTLYTPTERQHLAAKVEKQFGAVGSSAPGSVAPPATTTSAVSTSTGSGATPVSAPASAANEVRIDRIQQRLEEVAARLESLEQKLADWEK